VWHRIRKHRNVGAGHSASWATVRGQGVRCGAGGRAAGGFTGKAAVGGSAGGSESGGSATHGGGAGDSGESASQGAGDVRRGRLGDDEGRAKIGGRADAVADSRAPVGGTGGGRDDGADYGCHVATAGASEAAGCLGEDYCGEEVDALAPPIRITFDETVVDDTLATMDTLVELTRRPTTPPLGGKRNMGAMDDAQSDSDDARSVEHYKYSNVTSEVRSFSTTRGNGIVQSRC